MRFGLKVAQSGKSAPSSADPRKNPTDVGQKGLVFNTDLLTFKYIKRGKLPTTPGGQTYSVDHNQGYAPSFRVYELDPVTGVIGQIEGGSISGAWVDTQRLYYIGSGSTLIYFIGADDLDTVDS